MTLEEHNTIISNLLSLTDNNTEIQSLALQLQDDYRTVNANEEKNKQMIEDLKNERDKYAKLNNELWLRQMTNKEENEPNEEKTEPPKKRNFEDLNFD